MIINGIKCLSCGDVVYSRTRHDMRGCTCGDVAIDGGFDYKKVSYRKSCPENIQLDIDVTKDELYHDWNNNVNNFGLIKFK